MECAFLKPDWAFVQLDYAVIHPDYALVPLDWKLSHLDYAIASLDCALVQSDYAIFNLDSAFLHLDWAFRQMDWAILYPAWVFPQLKRAEPKWFCKSMLTFGVVRCFMLAMSDAHRVLPGELLKATSRSFYLTLRVLPAAVRPQIGLAYLLARTTDTIADTEIVPPALRIVALEDLRKRISGRSFAPLNFGELAKQQNLSAEKLLLEKVEASLSALQNLSEADRQLIREVLDTITSGQELDLRRFGKFSAGTRVSSPSASPNNLSSAAAGDSRAPNIVALETAAELDDYTYRVAGCVGEFWTKICRAHLFPNATLDEQQFIADGIRFGKGLQLVNILRDLPKDLRNGRCYLPREKLAEAGLSPEDLLSPANEARFRGLYNSYLDMAETLLAAGWNYTNSIPRGHVRVRLACAWPVLIGAKTISRLREGGILDPQNRIKITRGEVRGILLRSVAGYPFAGVWQKLFVTGRKAVASEAKLT